MKAILIQYSPIRIWKPGCMIHIQRAKKILGLGGSLDDGTLNNCSHAFQIRTSKIHRAGLAPSMLLRQTGLRCHHTMCNRGYLEGV